MSKRWIVALWVLFTGVCALWVTAALVADVSWGLRLLWTGFAVAVYGAGCALWAVVQAEKSGQ